MDTVVDIQVVLGKNNTPNDAEASILRAFEAFRKVEQACSRFSPDSELMAACRKIGMEVPVSPYVFEPLHFAMAMAHWTDGVFDPTVGKWMEKHGFQKHYLTGQIIDSPFTESVTYRDIILNEQEHTLYLCQPLVIDLGAVAKGFAIDLAVKELKELPFEGFVVNAGGDLYAGGFNELGKPWEIKIQHPEQEDQWMHTIELSNEAICTSGSYARKSPVSAGTHHLFDPKSKQSPTDWISCSVIAPYAMMADALSTAAFLLGSPRAEQLIQETQLRGMLITPDLHITRVGDI